jgi:hypothetical protein
MAPEALKRNKMPQNQNQNLASNSQTLVIDAEEFIFETVEQHNGIATVVKFKLDNPGVRLGDVLLILSGAEIHFHGFIGGIGDGYAIAADRAGSMLLAGVH